MKEKLKYSPVDLNITALELKDVISTSGQGGNMSNDNDPNYEPGGWT